MYERINDDEVAQLIVEKRKSDGIDGTPGNGGKQNSGLFAHKSKESVLRFVAKLNCFSATTDTASLKLLIEGLQNLENMIPKKTRRRERTRMRSASTRDIISEQLTDEHGKG